MLINSFATHTDNTQIKVKDSSNSKNKVHSTFVVGSKTSNLVHICDRHKIKPAHQESVKNTYTSDGNLLLAINIFSQNTLTSNYYKPPSKNKGVKNEN